MACPSMKEKLSTYLDGALDANEKTEVEEHLKTCDPCREYYDELTAMAGRLRDLEVIESPPWLRQKAMAAIREEADRRKSFWKRLFYPMHLKIPAGAFAMIAVAVITVYIFRDAEPEVKLAKAPQDGPARTAVQETAASGDSAKAGPALTKSPQEPRELEAKKDAALPAKELRAKAPEEDKKSASAVGSSLPESPAQESAREPVYPAPAKMLSKEATGGSAVKDAPKAEPVSAAAGLKASGVKRKEPLLLSISVKDIEQGAEDIRRAVRLSSGSVVREEAMEKKKVLLLDMPSGQIKSLLERLRSIGEIGQEIPAQEGAPVQVSIRIEVVEKSL